jgi:hypothetical protein
MARARHSTIKCIAEVFYTRTPNKNKLNQSNRIGIQLHKISSDISQSPAKTTMKLSVSFFAFASVWRFGHGQEQELTYLHGSGSDAEATASKV